MSDYEMVVSYLTAMFGRFRTDEDGGGMAEYIVITGIALVAAVVVGGILWSKLKGGAEQVNVPSPAAP
jgi:Flp pilus assembly pilin Flp